MSLEQVKAAEEATVYLRAAIRVVRGSSVSVADARQLTDQIAEFHRMLMLSVDSRTVLDPLPEASSFAADAVALYLNKAEAALKGATVENDKAAQLRGQLHGIAKTLDSATKPDPRTQRPTPGSRAHVAEVGSGLGPKRKLADQLRDTLSELSHRDQSVFCVAHGNLIAQLIWDMIDDRVVEIYERLH